MVIDAIYISEHSKRQPKEFNGFIKLESHLKKPEWCRYAFINDFYKENINELNPQDLTVEDYLLLYSARFGHIKYEDNNVDPRHKSHIIKNYHTHKNNYKQRLISKALSIVNCYDLDSNTIKPRKYFWSNGRYVVRQCGIHETDLVKELINKSRRENPGMFLDECHSEKNIEKYVELGHVIIALDSRGVLRGMQAFTPRENFIEAEPFTYISKEAREQGIFAIYHEMSIEAGNYAEADYIYSRCNTSNETMAAVYKAYGYIKQQDIKTIGNRKVYEFQFPLNGDGNNV